MLDSIIKFSIRHKLAVAFCTLFLIIWGIWSASKLPVDAVPDITNNQVQIITVAPTLAGQEVEQLITFPIEQSIANIPGVEETRSISRFGLSVITVVFQESVDIYFGRQLLNEKLKEAGEQIPAGLGRPQLGPVSTGLGEVYQYILHPRKGSEAKYSPQELRSMQDWIVARQLYGTPGIAEVNSFGGALKQYEVAVDPFRLKAMGVSITDIFTALQKNNQNTGGAYIDKKPNAYFIRGIGLATSLEDIRNIAVKTNAGTVPVFIRDVADVQMGSALRYGAMSYNGEVDAVGGVVMMMKGANSNEVVNNIKAKIPTIQKSLPPDVMIEPFLDRTDLVKRAIGTVEKNLIEGALIVIFVLVIFLGNLRAGLIVASAIPLALLFALGMMNVFGVSANLMSLGAIDFGLIVDGAVIIVEATLHHLGLRKSMHRLTQAEMDNEVYQSASKIRSSAAFGEIIILIVYIPILTLSGIEGKMFTPMAKTVGFAILGALLLSLTYIPMMCALFLSKKPIQKINFADKMMAWLQRRYEPLLVKSLQFKYWFVGAALALFGISLLLFKNMGGEFIPQLQEGDFAFHCILPQGSSLSQSVETSMQASRIIRQFDEVKMVVGKTGSAEVPTDPMPPEASDLIIVLKPKKEWKVKRSYEELSHAIMEKLEIIPGIFFEANQPIQMRFNELMTGIRQDVAVKIFGENMDSLAHYAGQVAALIQQVPGATAPQIERVAGMPQINVAYNRTRLANYGLNVEDVNNIISAAFAGKVAGQIFEDEKRFDLVVRLDSAHRTDIEDVNNLMLPMPSGIQVPLVQVAEVSYQLGPAQISREAGKRRIVIGFNVQGRDVQSVVKDIQKKLDKAVSLPTGYYFTYGGQFENLQKATGRLMIAVPVSLLLIFMLLYFTFQSVRQAALIFTAIPMSAIGGIIALLIRDMPFSISAGVGFIALFGVAVLNGIVLIGTFNQLQKEGITDVLTRVRMATKIRLRPVLMTASVASLGFLPMALSTGAGAEVQKPLATVVIGGLVTATLLTLFVLPMLYIIFHKKDSTPKSMNMKIILLPALLLIGSGALAQQTRRISRDTALAIALKNNGRYALNQSAMQAAMLNARTANEIPKTGIFAENEDLRPADKKGVLKIGISQSIAWPGFYAARKNYLQQQLKYAQMNRAAVDAEIKREVNTVYYQLWYLQDKLLLFQQLDSVYSSMLQAAALRHKTGDAPALDKMAAAAAAKELNARMQQCQKELITQQQQLMLLLNKNEWILPLNQPLAKADTGHANSNAEHPVLALQQQQVAIAASNIALQKNANKPEFSGRFFTQQLWGASNPYSGFSVTASFPLWGMGAYKNKVKAAVAEQQVQEQTLQYQRQTFKTQREVALTELQKNAVLLHYYESTGLQQANEILKAAALSYKAGEISFADMSQYMSQAIGIKQNYLDVLQLYNQSAIQYHYINPQ